MYSSGLQGFSTPTTLRPGRHLEGVPVSSHNRCLQGAALFSAGGVAQVWSIAPGTAADTTAYLVTVLDRLGNALGTVTFTSGASATAGQIQAGILAALQANTVINGAVTLAAGTSNTVRLTAKAKGTAYTFSVVVSGGGTGYAASIATPASDIEIPFGRVVVQSDARTVRLPNASGDTPLGITRRTEAYGAPDTVTGTDSYYGNMPINILQGGQMPIRCLNDFNPTLLVRFSYANSADAGLVAAGSSFASSSEFKGARFINSGVAGEIAIVDVNLPA